MKTYLLVMLSWLDAGSYLHILLLSYSLFHEYVVNYIVASVTGELTWSSPPFPIPLTWINLF